MELIIEPSTGGWEQCHCYQLYLHPCMYYIQQNHCHHEQTTEHLSAPVNCLLLHTIQDYWIATGLHSYLNIVKTMHVIMHVNW